ncbi:MAG: cysteine hydrolase [Chloroflexota bacterium]|nr:cysteine hydrolase [Chloroflexota bacterium]
MATVDARPNPLTIDPRATAIIVVDMQNDFGAEGGMFVRAGIDISGIQAAVEPTARTLDVARSAGMPVIYLKMGFAPDLSDAGGPNAPNLVRHLEVFGVGQAVAAPDGRSSRVLVRDTWNTDILAELAPRPGDRIVNKHRFSGFFETELDALLKDLGVTTLVFTGCTTSVCVESTLRDAFFRDYHCLLLADCTAEPIGDGLPRSNHEATLLLVELLFGWVADSSAFARAVIAQPAGAAAD